ncbi:flippase-like domain-containing protein [candidate division KSB1 bacterium]|nr:flippase-like domain-containing protein [candidate division KSB1 bacterium]
MKSIKYIIFVFIVLIAVIYFYFNGDKLKLLIRINWLDAVILFIFVFLSFLVLSYQFYYYMRIFKIRLLFREYFGLTVCSTMFNYYLPARGGLVARAFYLKKKHGFYYSHYTSLIVGSYLITYNTTALFGLIVGIILYINGLQNQLNLIFIFTFLLVVSLAGTTILLIIVRKKRFAGRSKVSNFFSRVKNGLKYFRQNRHLILNIISINLLFIVVMALRLYWSFCSLDISVNFFQIFCVSALANFTMVISITPANLGIREGIVGFSASLLGVELPDAILAAALDRLAGMIFNFAFGLYYSRLLLHDVNWKRKPDIMDN